MSPVLRLILPDIIDILIHWGINNDGIWMLQFLLNSIATKKVVNLNVSNQTYRYLIASLLCVIHTQTKISPEFSIKTYADGAFELFNKLRTSLQSTNLEEKIDWLAIEIDLAVNRAMAILRDEIKDEEPTKEDLEGFEHEKYLTTIEKVFKDIKSMSDEDDRAVCQAAGNGLKDIFKLGTNSVCPVKIKNLLKEHKLSALFEKVQIFCTKAENSLEMPKLYSKYEETTLVVPSFISRNAPQEVHEWVESFSNIDEEEFLSRSKKDAASMNRLIGHTGNENNFEEPDNEEPDYEEPDNEGSANLNQDKDEENDMEGSQQSIGTVEKVPISRLDIQLTESTISEPEPEKTNKKKRQRKRTRSSRRKPVLDPSPSPQTSEDRPRARMLVTKEENNKIGEKSANEKIPLKLRSVVTGLPVQEKGDKKITIRSDSPGEEIEWTESEDDLSVGPIERMAKAASPAPKWDKKLRSRMVPKLEEKLRRPRIHWTPVEEDRLRDGVRVFGLGKWSEILKTGGFNEVRTSVDLKDKWRNMKCKLESEASDGESS